MLTSPLTSGARAALFAAALMLASCAVHDPHQTLADMPLAYDDTIVTASARTVDFNGQAFVPRYLRIEKSGAAGDLAVDVAVSNAVFGISKDMTVTLGVPYIKKRLTPAGGGTPMGAEGLGDIKLLGKWRFYKETGIAETTEAALLFGLELPTGQNDIKQGGLRLPAPLQPGSGSLDGIVGGVFTRVDGQWQLNTDLIAKLNTRSDGYRFGNTLAGDVGVQYRLFPVTYSRLDQLTVNLVAELNSSWSERDQLGSSSVTNSGGFKLFATPGIQVILNRNLLFETAVQLPLVMDLGGSALEEDFVFIFGLRARF